jgi:hypothetical protein
MLEPVWVVRCGSIHPLLPHSTPARMTPVIQLFSRPDMICEPPVGESPRPDALSPPLPLTQCLVRPCVARGFRRSAGSSVLHQCIRPLTKGALIKKSAMTPPLKSNAAHTYPHRAREARAGQRYTSHTCARPHFVPLLDTHMGEWRTRTQTR